MDNVVSYYNSYNEDIRLSKDNLHKTEYLTSIYLLNKYLKPHSTILDVSAGTGIYSFYLAQKGHEVIAGDIVPKHIDIINEKMKDSPVLKSASIMDARDLSAFSTGSFDCVLCMGPLYHLKDDNDKRKAISECLRVLKADGILFTAYINRQASYLLELKKEADPQWNFLNNIIDKGFQAGINSEHFYFSSPKEMEDLMSEHNIITICNAAADGIGYMIADKINTYSESDYKTFVDNHIKQCTDPYLLGYSLHGLHICRKMK